MEKQEKEITTITAYGKGCIGCTKHNKDIMISYQAKNTEGVKDLFLTEYQAEYLVKRLKMYLTKNKESCIQSE